MKTNPPTGLREQQLLFANYLRNPSSVAPPDIELRRLRVYRELFFGNISQLLATTFPVIRSIMADEAWLELVNDFYARHHCKTPLFPYIAEEFVYFLLHERSNDNDYPFLVELAQYEWSEIALRHMDAELSAIAESSGAMGELKPEITPFCFPMVFQYPVHRIGINFIPQTPSAEPAYLLVYRDSQETVRFIESSAATFRLLQLLSDKDLPDMSSVIACIAREMGSQDIVSIQGMVADVIKDLFSKTILLNRP